MTSLVIDGTASNGWDSTIIVAWRSWPVRTTRSFSARQLENDEWQSCTQFRESEIQMPWDSQLVMSALRMVNGDGKWFNQINGKQCHVWCLYSSFHISSAGYLQSDPHSHYLRVLALMWNISLQNLIREVHFLSRVYTEFVKNTVSA